MITYLATDTEGNVHGFKNQPWFNLKSGSWSVRAGDPGQGVLVLSTEYHKYVVIPMKGSWEYATLWSDIDIVKALLKNLDLLDQTTGTVIQDLKTECRAQLRKAEFLPTSSYPKHWR